MASNKYNANGSSIAGEPEVLDSDLLTLTNDDEWMIGLCGDQDLPGFAYSRQDSTQKAARIYRFFKTRIVAAQEAERKRLSCELHDRVGQLLSLLALQADQALKKLRDSQLADKLAEEIECLELIPLTTREVIEEVRNVCKETHPSILDDLGVLKAVSWQCRRFQETGDIEVSTDFDLQEESIPDILKIPIYRIVQEALNNAVRHSGAQCVQVSIRRVNDALNLTIADNGKGFDLQQLFAEELGPALGSIGHSSMRERTEVLGGDFSIESAKNKGSTVHASWTIAGLC